MSFISFASTVIREQLNLTPFEYGLLLSASLMGMIPGTLVFGYLSDKVGRKKIFRLDLFFFLVFGALASISSNLIELVTSRFFLVMGYFR